MVNHYIERRRVQSALFKSRARGSTSTLTLAEWLGILEHFDYKCAYCKGSFKVIEHIIALKHGGGTVATNVVPSCYECNAKKDRVGSRPDFDIISKVTESLHSFLAEHGPFDDIPNHSQIIYYVCTEKLYEEYKKKGREVMFIEFRADTRNQTRDYQES